MGGRTRFQEALASYANVLLDTMVLVYLLEGHTRYASLAEKTLETIESGAMAGIISVVTLAEILTAPAQAGDRTAMRDYELHLLNFPHLTIWDVTVDIAREAAQLRAHTGLPMPDALILATATVANADAVITNDKRWRKKVPECAILILDDYVDASPEDAAP